MHLLVAPSIIIITCLLSIPIKSMALPSTPQVTSSLSQLNATIGDDPPFACLPQPPFRTVRLPSQQDCAAALRSWPTTPDVQNFHTGPGAFPDFRSYKNCVVLIELDKGSTLVRSSWLEIHTAALEVNLACLSDHGSGNVGGVTRTGAGNHVKITLKGRG